MADPVLLVKRDLRQSPLLPGDDKERIITEPFRPPRLINNLSPQPPGRKCDNSRPAHRGP